jgi:hypothetical protein
MSSELKITLLLCILKFALTAQPKDSVNWYFQYTSSGNYNSTNLYKSYLISNSLKVTVKRSDLKSNLSLNWLFGEQQETIVNKDISTLFDLNLYKTLPHFYYWGLVSYNSLYSLKVNHQLQSGAGAAYIPIDQKTLQVNISEGFLYDYSDVLVQDSIRDIYQTPRNSLRLQLKIWLGQRITFISTGFLQNSLETKNDYIVKGECALSLKLGKWFSINARCTYNRMSRTQKENLFITYGVLIEKKL